LTGSFRARPAPACDTHTVLGFEPTSGWRFNLPTLQARRRVQCPAGKGDEIKDTAYLDDAPTVRLAGAATPQP
jgi:hypothetical protein